MKKILTSLMVLAPMVANAQTAPEDWGYNDFSTAGQNINLGSRPVRETVAGIINIILGFLGILTTVAIIWGGIRMLTSYGDAEKNQEGKNVVVAGVIGLLIVLTSYAISRFILSNLYNETV